MFPTEPHKFSKVPCIFSKEPYVGCLQIDIEMLTKELCTCVGGLQIDIGILSKEPYTCSQKSPTHSQKSPSHFRKMSAHTTYTRVVLVVGTLCCVAVCCSVMRCVAIRRSVHTCVVLVVRTFTSKYFQTSPYCFLLSLFV